MRTWGSWAGVRWLKASATCRGEFRVGVSTNTLGGALVGDPAWRAGPGQGGCLAGSCFFFFFFFFGPGQTDRGRGISFSGWQPSESGDGMVYAAENNRRLTSCSLRPKQEKGRFRSQRRLARFQWSQGPPEHRGLWRCCWLGIQGSGRKDAGKFRNGWCQAGWLVASRRAREALHAEGLLGHGKKLTRL